jgi:hypothetical protein
MIKFSQFLDETGRCWAGHRPVPGKKPFSKGSCVKEETKSGDSSLHDWFSKSKSSDGKPGWVQLGGRYAGKSCAKQPGQTTKPKCGSSKMASNMSDKEEDAAARRKRMKDPNPNRSGKAINVATEEVVAEDACTTKVKSRYSVWPSAYASGALVKCRKVGAANWGNKTKKESIEILSFSAFLEEAANAAQQAAIAINMKKNGVKPKNEEVELDEEEDKVNARKMYHKHFVASMKSMASSPKQKHHQAEMAKYKAMMGDSFINQVAPKKFAKFDKKIKEETLDEAAPFKDLSSAVKYGSDKVKTHRDHLDGIEVYKHKDGGYDVNHTMNANGRNSLNKSGAKHLGTIYRDTQGKVSHNIKEEVELDEVAAWQRKEGKNPEGGLNQKGIASYRAENPGSKLSTAVTTEPSKLKAGSKSANRRKSFCARMSGMKRKLTSAKTASDPDSRINKSLRKWNC